MPTARSAIIHELGPWLRENKNDTMQQRHNARDAGGGSLLGRPSCIALSFADRKMQFHHCALART